MIRLHNMRTRPGSKHRVKRLGCGESSGHGKTSGKGHKGQKARSGGSLRLGFEGGQMPLIRRLPKRGFNNAAFHKNYAILNLSDLSGNGAGVKILGGGELKHALTIEADKISASAREKVEKAGGSITLRQKPVQGPRADAPPAKEAEATEPSAKPKVKAAKKPAAKKKAPAKAAPKKKSPRKS
jgi:large subunit ribosomal protein L15